MTSSPSVVDQNSSLFFIKIFVVLGLNVPVLLFVELYGQLKRDYMHHSPVSCLFREMYAVYHADRACDTKLHGGRVCLCFWVSVSALFRWMCIDGSCND